MEGRNEDQIDLTVCRPSQGPNTGETLYLSENSSGNVNSNMKNYFKARKKIFSFFNILAKLQVMQNSERKIVHSL